MATLDQLRSLFPNAETDADVITQAAARFKINPADIASEVGYSQSRSGVTGQQFSSAIDRYQAGLYGVGEEAAKALGADKASSWMAAQRRENELQADLSSERARGMGAVQEWKDVNSASDLGSYAKGLAVQSLPYAAEALAGGLVARGVMSGTRAALAGAKTVEEAATAKRALNLGSTAGGVAASYPSAVGDVLSNQREEAGTTNPAAAAALGVPYAALNAFGVEGALARGTGARAVSLLDRTTGLTGAALRTGASAAKSGLEEAAGETLQEMTNQLGRMAVNPNAELFSDQAMERYKESAIGGGLLGGMFGGAMGGWRRSSSFLENSNTAPDPQQTPNAPAGEIPQAMAAKSSASAENILAGLAGPSNLLGGRVSLYDTPTVPAAPVVAGGTTDVAFSQQQAQAEEQKVQEALKQQTAREQAFANTGAVFNPESNGGELSVFGQSIFGPQVAVFGNRLASQINSLPAHMVEITKAMALANSETGNKLVSFNYNGSNPMGSADALVKALGKAADKFQIGHVESTQQAAGILNKLSETTKGAQLDQINAIHFALTGENTTGWEASQTTKAKGAKNGKLQLQTDAGLGEVPVQGGAGQASDGGAGAVRPAQIQPVGTTGLGAGPSGQQAGQLPTEGIRTGTPVDADAGNVLVGGQGQGSGQVNETPVQASTTLPAGSVPAGGGQVSGEPQQAGQPTVAAEGVSTEPRATFYSSDLSHIPEARRIQIITELFHSVLAPKQQRGNVVQASTRMEILRLALLEQFSQRTIAEFTKLSEDAVQKQLERMGVKLVDGQFDIVDPEFAVKLRAAADAYRSSEFPDGIGEGQLAGLYAEKYKGPDVESRTLTEELQEGEQEGKPGAKLQEELYGKEEGEGKTMGTVATAGGSQGAVDSAGQTILNRINKLQQKVDANPEDAKAAADLAKAWAAYAEDQKSRAVKGEIEVAAQEETEEDLTGEPIAAEKEKEEKAEDRVGKEAAAKAREQTAKDRKGLQVGDTVVNPKLGTGTVLSFAGNGDATTVTVKFASGQTKELSVAAAKLEKTNAVQEPSTTEVSVRQRARGGKKVGEGNTEGGKAATESKGEVAILTPQEQWEALADKTPGMPPYESLTKDEKTRWDDLAHRGVANLAAANEIVGGGDLKFGKDTTESKAKNPYTAAELLAEIKDFVRADIPGRKLIIVDSIEDLLASPDPVVREVAQEIAKAGAYGVAVDGRGFLIANRIEKGRGRAKFMHEVGAHLGLENLLPKALYDKLTQQLVNWAKKDDGSLESELASRAAERVMYAGTPKEQQRNELLAYFIEEAMQAGINPTADIKNSAALTAWFRTLWAAFKVAVRKLGFNPEKLTAQDVVNLAFGAARLEISGTFHGTAAIFRRFSHKFMGSGEGAQAYGWGTYLAQRAGIAKGYWAADVERKQGPMADYLKPGTKTAESLTRLATQLKAAPEEALAAFGKYGPSSPTVKSVLGLGAAFKFDQNFHQKLLDVVDRKVRRGMSVAEAIDEAMVANAPEGSFMRVDTALDSSNTLDWGAPLSRQPEVLATLREKLPMGLQEAIAEQFDQNVEDLEDLTGEDLYRALQFLERDQGLVSELSTKEIAAGQAADKVASEFLDSIGINGLKFLDAKSRGQARVEERIAQAERKLAKEEKYLQELKAQLDAERQELVDRLANAEAKLAAGESFARVTVEQTKRFIGYFDDPKGTNALLLDTYEKSVQMAKDNLRKQQERLTAPITRNLVVFNDANIFRVGAAIGAHKQRMQFGVEANIGSLPKVAQKPVRNSIASLTDWASKALDRVVFTGDLVNRAVEAGIQSARKFERLLAERGTKARELERAVERIADMYATLPEKDKGTGPDSVNQFLFDSTRTMKWGYGKYRDPEMGARFDALDPKSQDFVKSVFAHGDKMLSKKKQTVLDYTSSTYDAQIAAETDPVKKAALVTDKAADLKKFATLFAIREGKPYAPIKRMGNYVVVAKSDAYREAERNGDSKELRKLESDPDHYHVSFTETKSDARALADELKDQGFFGASADSVDFFEKAKFGEDLFGNSSSLDAITRLRSMTNAKAAAGEKGAAAMQRLVSDLYLQSLAEGSARKSEMRRRGVAGEVDMLRSFAAQGRADAQFVASVEMNPQVQDAIQEMRNQTNRGGNRTRKSELMNELMARYDQSLDRQETPTINKITRLSSIFYLATSPAYYLQNLTQPWMMSLPAMAGHHEYTKASGELFKAYSQLSGVMKSAKLFEQQFDFSKVPADVRQAVQELVNRGKIDIGLETELGEFKIDGSGKLTDAWNKVDKGMRIAVQKVESINRLSTAIAAYRLELAKTGSQVAALDYADRILTETHGDYTGFNAPRVFNHPIGKVALQFRKFQLIQLTFYAKLIRDAFTGKDRAMAMKALAYSLGHTGLLAGVVGLPGYAAISAILGAMFGDDDEEFDLTKELRTMIGDEDIANMILRGAPTIAGMDLSGKVGAGTMLSIMPYSQADLTTRSGVTEAIGTLLGGAAGNLAAKFADGVGLMLKGDWYKGLEQMLPKGIADAMKAARVANEGMTRRNGDVVLPASEVSSLDTVWQALGISPVKQSVIYERQQNIRDMDQRFQDRATEVKNRYTKAVKAGDTAGMAEQRDAWNKLQVARANSGYTRQPVSDLLKAPQQQAKRERQTIGGVQYNKANRAAVMAEVNQ